MAVAVWWGSSTESRRRRNRDPRWLGTAMTKDAELRALLATLDSKARDDLRRVLIRDQADRDAIFLAAASLPRRPRQRLGRRHRLPDDASDDHSELVALAVVRAEALEAS